jgi:hypothetical protein
MRGVIPPPLNTSLLCGAYLSIGTTLPLLCSFQAVAVVEKVAIEIYTRNKFLNRIFTTEGDFFWGGGG